jgi:electron transport complex protein RnfD
MKPFAISSPRQTNSKSVSNLMTTLLICLCPGIILSCWFFGIGILLNILIATFAALVFEAACLVCRGKDPKVQMTDLSAVVTAVLFALTIPVGTPWTLIVAGIAFAILISKHAYGGLGQNLFNPAMTGYLFLLLSFPLAMTTWHIPLNNLTSGMAISPLSMEGIRQSLNASFPFMAFDSSMSKELIDGMTMATPLTLTQMASPNALAAALSSDASIWSRDAGTGWEIVNMAYLLGGLTLLGLKVIRWHIPLAIIGTVTLLSLAFYSPGSATITGTPYMHLFGSATILGAFFIATDPVSAATTTSGRLIYGVIIGSSLYSIRVWGSYLDAVAIAVIFGNFWAPMLDHFFKPRSYGHKSKLSQLIHGLKS